MRNVYFELTKEFNRRGNIALLTSGQAVVWYRTALMSKDGDWVIDESTTACETILEVLSARDARYRPGAPLDPRWLAGGWSSHFEFADEKGRRVRCDFLSRPPRTDLAHVREVLRSHDDPDQPAVIDLESLILMKRTQRAKDYPVIGELARLLPENREILYTTDPDRILELAGARGEGVDRLAVQEARRGGAREEVVTALAREADALQQADRARLDPYAKASRAYVSELMRTGVLRKPLVDAHPEIVEVAARSLPETLAGLEGERGAR